MRCTDLSKISLGGLALLVAFGTLACEAEDGGGTPDTAVADTASADATGEDTAAADATGEDTTTADATGEDTTTADATGDTVGGAVAIIASEGGVVELPDGLGRLIIPADALAADTTITVALEVSDKPGSIGPAIVFGPSGTTFDPPATLELNVDDSGWDTSFDAYGLTPTLVIDQGDTFEGVLGLGKEDDGPERFLVKHFSTYEWTPGPSSGWKSDLAFPKACYDLWSEPAAGGSPLPGANQSFIGSCPQARAMLRKPNAEASSFPPSGLGGVDVSFMGVLEWPDVAGGHMTVVNTDATSGTLNPSGQVALHWDVYIRFWSVPTAPSWCTGSNMQSVIEESIARAGGETERMLYEGVTATCKAPPATGSTNGVITTSYSVCQCQVAFGAFPWPNEPIPYTVSGTQLDLFGELFDFSTKPGVNRWWMNVPVIATLDMVTELPETSLYAFAKMKLLVQQ
ncbi:MAG: hypothetical protein EP329_22595 [Deltaproteobacteria bacterium]|nr:MAG: hypothetical protein EP329_22595 [Deltaproteobacteria bacterium]